MAATTRSVVTAESRRRRAWLWRILECVVVTMILFALLTTIALAGFGSGLRFALTGAAAVLATGVGIYWGASTSRLLRHSAFAAAGFLVTVLALSTAVAGGSGAVLAVGGRTVTCEVVSVERLRCPDGTTVTVDHQEAAGTAVVYDPRGWVDAQLESRYRSADHTALRWTFLSCVGWLLLQFLAAVVSGLIRRRRTTADVDDWG